MLIFSCIDSDIVIVLVMQLCCNNAIIEANQSLLQMVVGSAKNGAEFYLMAMQCICYPC